MKTHLKEDTDTNGYVVNVEEGYHNEGGGMLNKPPHPDLNEPEVGEGNVLLPNLILPKSKTADSFSTSGSSKTDAECGTRQTWGKEMEFVLACVGNAVGLGNLWRFPYLCYESGGGAFLIPYFIMLIVCGIPLLYMEFAMGQFTRQGPIGALKKLCPFFQGAGMATVMLSFLLCSYYNVILSWALYYLFSSFTSELPWASCNHTWASPNCWDDYSVNGSFMKPNDTVSPSQDYFEHQVLQQSEGIHDFGNIRWELFGLLFLSWVLVYLALWKGVKITGKVVYFTATFPYLVIIVLLVRGVTLPGSQVGIDFFIKPKWELLKTPKVWVNAAAQNFNSIGIAFGSMVAFSSYNKREQRIFRDVLTITCLNSLTSILAGFAVFSILGYISVNQQKDISEVVTDGPGLVFIVYPEAFVTMPVAQLFSVLFFFNLLCLAIDSQFASVEVVITSLYDHFGPAINRYLKRREVLVLIVCIVAFLLSLPNIFKGGIYYFKLIDFYSSGISLMLVALVEVIAVTWFYGARRLARNVKEMTGTSPNIYFVICWYFLAPVLIAAIMIFNWVDYTPVSYGEYEFPGWGTGIGWVMASLSLVCIPIGMIKAFIDSPGSGFIEKFKNVLTADVDDLTPDTQGVKPGPEMVLKESKM